MSKPQPPGFKSRKVTLGDIIQDATLQVRKELHAGTIDRYLRAYQAEAEMPPIKLALIDGSLYLLDGWHRLEALRRLGRREDFADIAEMDREAALWHAARANLGNGLPLKHGELRSVFRAYIKAKQYRGGARGPKSYRDIAKELGFAPHTTIRNWMRKDFPKLASRMGGSEMGNHDAGPPKEDPEGIRMEGFREALSQAVANYRALQDRGVRGEAIRDLEQALADMRSQPHRKLQIDDLPEF